MLIQPAEDSFQKGIELYNIGKRREALAFFNGALEIERRFGAERPQARYLSFYGLCLSQTNGDPHEALRACREAASIEGYRPEICRNLGLVLLGIGRRGEAWQAFQRGLKMQPGHPGILRDLKRMGTRRKPVLPFLTRQHPLNVWLGKMRTNEVTPIEPMTSPIPKSMAARPVGHGAS
jgi:tetratricopeptide (TPR) repeat protein